ncbi:fluoride efflux transporter CrcB [Arenimonas composti]|uniref:Fluoride-specific ion channel FluC n=1 Tax=Arenimonas composti TR7-09 = DSM 18010 TaxID=1121013 RepID=A0A091BWI8_9GAMM|nr:fluoride efflux transporter CrcB [Arenimonas composti]KFN48710.1 hypothetical protein P873_13720 [Arenimonas composti TR7-09 = DSM 18010]
MPGWLWVGLGGALGAIARYGVSLALAGSAARFPWPTFAVNVLGCLLIGLVAGVLARAPDGDTLRLFVVTGVLGGFTTFSAFGLETLTLMRRGDAALAAVYVLGSVGVCLFAVWLGSRLAE